MDAGGSADPSSSLFTSTIAPIIAARSNTEATSKGNAKSPKRLVASGTRSPPRARGSFASAKGGDLIPLAASLFTDYAFPFEVASVLLLAALVGAIVLVKQDER